MAHLHLDRFLALGWCLGMCGMICLLVSETWAARSR
jgi:sulfite exporter TauE/SafE